MSEQAVQILTVTVGAVGTANRNLFRVPTGYGGITLLNVWLVSDSAATIVSQLANMGTGLGTAVSAVVGTLTDGTLTANVKKAYSITTAY
jgi:urocanate hydratase